MWNFWNNVKDKLRLKVIHQLKHKCYITKFHKIQLSESVFNLSLIINFLEILHNGTHNLKKKKKKKLDSTISIFHLQE